jgi:hypothetical protein
MTWGISSACCHAGAVRGARPDGGDAPEAGAPNVRSILKNDRDQRVGVAAEQPHVRLAFWPSSTTDDVMNGGWWPRTRDPAAELPDLATSVAERLGVVRRIALNTDAWTSWPRQLVIGGAKVQLDWCTGDAHTIRLTSDDASHLDLLAIPPDTPTILALTCLARAGRDIPRRSRLT